MRSRSPWLMALALDVLVDGVGDDEAVDILVSAAKGNREALRGAYARAVALAGELPDDVVAGRMVRLLRRAMRRPAGRASRRGGLRNGSPGTDQLASEPLPGGGGDSV